MMDTLPYIILFVFGLIVGSFLNVVILRFDTGQSIAKGRSKCFSCAKELSWYELVPLLSFIFQKGKCLGCGTRISFQYPLVEAATGLLFVLAWRSAGEPFDPVGLIAFVLLSAVLCLYAAIFVYDLKHKIIPDLFSYMAALGAVSIVALDWYSAGTADLSRIVAGPAFFAFFFFFWFVSDGKWMGLGDAKLALSVGWILGLSSGTAALLLSFWIGAAVTLIVMAVQRIFRRDGGLGMKSEIPFGPYILAGFLISLAWGIDFQGILSFLAL